MEEHKPEEPTLTVPLVDGYAGRLIYARSFVRFAVIGALAGALVLGLLGYALAAGLLAPPGLGQWAAAGTGAASFAGAGVGAALGGLSGALLALARLRG